MGVNHLVLKDHIKEVEEYYKKGLERIKDYYNGRNEEPKLRDPPHEILEKSASQFFREAMNSQLIKNDIDWNSYPDSSLYEVCLGCGTEILMKAIILLEKPEEFIKKPEMGFNDAKGILVKKILKKLTKKQRKRIKDVLCLIKIKRDKWAHLSFHRYSAYHEDYQIFNLLEYLYGLYFPNSKILSEIRDHKNMYKVQAGLDFEKIDLNES